MLLFIKKNLSLTIHIGNRRTINISPVKIGILSVVLLLVMSGSFAQRKSSRVPAPTNQANKADSKKTEKKKEDVCLWINHQY